MLGQHALYDPAVVVTPDPSPILNDGKEWEVRVKFQNQFSSIFYPFNPMDVVAVLTKVVQEQQKTIEKLSEMANEGLRMVNEFNAARAEPFPGSGTSH